jgi:hypothetical protein
LFVLQREPNLGFHKMGPRIASVHDFDYQIRVGNAQERV